MNRTICPSANDVIKGGALITNSENIFYAGGLLVVHAYSGLSGRYHNTYAIGVNRLPDEGDVIRCLDCGYKYYEVKDLLCRVNMQLVNS